MELMDRKTFRRTLWRKELLTDAERESMSREEQYDYVMRFFYSAGFYRDKDGADLKRDAKNLLWYALYFVLGFGSAGGLDRIFN